MTWENSSEVTGERILVRNVTEKMEQDIHYLPGFYTDDVISITVANMTSY